MNESALKVIAELYPKYGADFWKHMQWYSHPSNKWVACRSDIEVSIRLEAEYRVKPRTHIVNGIECPAPMSERPKGGGYFYLAPGFQPGAGRSSWDHHEIDEWRFRLGIFATEEDAIANFYAHFPHMKPEAK